MKRKKADPNYQVTHRVEVHEQKPRKTRVANGTSKRREYTHKYYEEHKEALKAKNHADYIKRKTNITVKERPIGTKKPIKADRSCRHCVNYPCFEGIETLVTDFAREGCRGYKMKGQAI
jgi:hypothetical protein